MGQYCPKCLSNEVVLPSSSIVHIVINGMRVDLNNLIFSSNKDGMALKKGPTDRSQILFQSNQSEEAFKQELAHKLEKFFAQYKSQPNNVPIKAIKIFSSDYECGHQCRLKGVNISVINHLISPHNVMDALRSAAKKHSIKLELTAGDID